MHHHWTWLFHVTLPYKDSSELRAKHFKLTSIKRHIVQWQVPKIESVDQFRPSTTTIKFKWKRPLLRLQMIKAVAARWNRADDSRWRNQIFMRRCHSRSNNSGTSSAARLINNQRWRPQWNFIIVSFISNSFRCLNNNLLFIDWNEAIKFHLNSSPDQSSMKITPKVHQKCVHRGN